MQLVPHLEHVLGVHGLVQKSGGQVPLLALLLLLLAPQNVLIFVLVKGVFKVAVVSEGILKLLDLVFEQTYFVV